MKEEKIVLGMGTDFPLDGKLLIPESEKQQAENAADVLHDEISLLCVFVRLRGAPARCLSPRQTTGDGNCSR